MKTIELRRHSTKTGHGDVHLSSEGAELARRVGATQLRGRMFTSLFVSSRQRAVDTMRMFSEGAGDFPSMEPKIFLETSDVFETADAITLWEGVCHEAERAGKDMMLAAIENDTERAKRVASLEAEAFRHWLKALPDPSNVLVVHHSPSIELLAYGLFHTVLPQLQPCEGIRIVENEQGLHVTSLQQDSTLAA